MNAFPLAAARAGGLLRGVAALLLAAAAPLVAAQDYPTKPVRIIVPFAAGGPADLYARVIAQRLQQAMGGSFFVDDRPGAGSIIGTDFVAKSKPDGYTLLVMSNTHTVNETLLPNKPFELMRDFVPVATINESDLLMVVHPSVQAKSVKEFIELAKKEPGKLNYASSGPGTPYHMAGELFKSLAGVDVVHVPHRASGDARNSVVSGTVQMMFDAVPTMLALSKAGQVHALGTSGSKRNPLTPELPTVAETVPGYDATIWLGVMAPKGTPKEVIDFLNQHINKVIELPEVKETWLKQGAVPLVKTTAEFDSFLHKDIDKWGKLIKSAHITVQ